MIILNKQESSFADQVRQASGTDLNACFHCRCCVSGCPFAHAMDYPPNSVIRLVQFGLKKEALECATIWLCVGCHTCSSLCPMAIDMSAIMDALRQMAMREGAKIAEPDILSFHQEVLDSVKRYGRTHKLEIMLRYKIRTRRWFDDMNVGLKMLSKRKLDLMPSRIINIDDVKRLFE